MKPVRVKKFETIQHAHVVVNIMSDIENSDGHFMIPKGTTLLYRSIGEQAYIPKNIPYFREIKTRRSKDTRTWLEKKLQIIFERLTGKKIKFVTKYDYDTEERNTPRGDSSLQLNFDSQEENNQSERSGGESSV